MVPWATKSYLKSLQNPLALLPPPPYILNVRSLNRMEILIVRRNTRHWKRNYLPISRMVEAFEVMDNFHLEQNLKKFSLLIDKLLCSLIKLITFELLFSIVTSCCITYQLIAIFCNLRGSAMYVTKAFNICTADLEY